MAEHFHNQAATKTNMTFPLLIALTALVLSLISGVVNYRQNNLSNLESSLRDTKDQLQLAKNDITDIRMKTMQQLVDAELAVKSQSQLQHENAKLSSRLKESAIRMRELETQIRRMDHKISAQAHDLRVAKKAGTKKKMPKKAKENSAANTASNALANVDVYVDKMESSQQQRLLAAMRKHGFKPKHLKLLESMHLSDKTTVFYYDASYKDIARNMVKALAAGSKGEVILKKGVSPYAKNKIIIHLIGQ